LGGGPSIEQAILLEHAKQLDEDGVLMAAEPSMDQMAATQERFFSSQDSKANTSLQDLPARRGPHLARDTNLQAKKYPEVRGI
jgi:dihydrodipicolinate synthase/N-acetylneuraminate lyase